MYYCLNGYHTTVLKGFGRGTLDTVCVVTACGDSCGGKGIRHTSLLTRNIIGVLFWQNFCFENIIIIL